MIKVLYNSLHLTGLFSGVQNTEEELMKEAFLHPYKDISVEALCPSDYLVNFDISTHNSYKRTSIDITKRLQRIMYEHFCIPLHIRGGIDLLHCPAYILPWGWTAKSVITVHDMIALDFPNYCSFLSQIYFRLFLPSSILRATRIITVSKTVKEDILRRYPDISGKIDVIYPGISYRFQETHHEIQKNEVRSKYQLPKKYILFVGNIEPKKNISRLIDAYISLKCQTNLTHALVIVGRMAWKYEDILQKMKMLSGESIYFLGYVASSDLPVLYSLADLFVFPSIYEGFGIPPLEAMACGVPVIASTGGALPETTGGNAFLINPCSVDAIASAICEVLKNPSLQYRMRENGLQYVKKFQWEKTWKATANVYRKAIGVNKI